MDKNNSQETLPGTNSGYRSLPALRILVAEDNNINQLILTKLFKTLGYNIDIAENGKQALIMAKRIEYDVILMDIQMPEMDGVEASSKIMEYYSHHHPPRIVAMTANAMRENQGACMEAGMIDYLTKPIYFDTLKTKLVEWTNPQLFHH